MKMRDDGDEKTVDKRDEGGIIESLVNMGIVKGNWRSFSKPNIVEKNEKNKE